MSSVFDQFQWRPQPAAQALINELLAGFLVACPGAQTLARRMEHETATRFPDWIDSIQSPRTPALRARLLETGFERRATPGATDCFIHPGAMFPAVILDAAPLTRAFIKVDSVIDFLSAWQIADDPATQADDIEGEPLAPMRRARAFAGADVPPPVTATA